MKKLKYILFILTFIYFIVPRETYAEEFYSGSYITYYQDANLQTQHLGAYGVYFVNGTSYVTNTSNFRDTWFYTTHLDTTNIQGGSIYIPYTIGHSVLENANVNTTHYADISSTCTEWTCTSSQSGSCIEYSCTNHPEGYDPSDTTIITTQYDANISLIIRCYYNGATTFTPGRIEGSNVVCPVQQNATFLYGIRIFHRLITIDTETYQLGLAAGVTTYNNATSKIIEKQEETTNALTDSSTNNNGISGATSDIQNMIPQDEKTEGFYNNIFTFYNRVNQSIDTTCSNYTLELMGKTITFPCINMANIFGDWWSIIDILCCIWPLLNIFNLIIGWVDGITDLEDLSYFKSAKHIHWSREDYRKGMYY